MTEYVVAWNEGTGNITLRYNGHGDGTIIVTSDDNNLTTSRSQTITLKTADSSSVANLESYFDSQSTITNQEFDSVILDSSDNILWGIKTDGTIYNVNVDLIGYDIDGIPAETMVRAIIERYYKITKTLTITQAGCDVNFKTADGKWFKTADGKYFTVQEE